MTASAQHSHNPLVRLIEGSEEGVGNIYAVKGVYDGKAAKPLEPVHARANAPVIITFLDEDAGAALFPLIMGTVVSES
ncbi:MAG: hypothetical protein NTW86_17605 [Candidatus Sumerlaeota bacterium]|nr:hypothetical protein [Candidatus Sumerlaeota bacterium]